MVDPGTIDLLSSDDSAGVVSVVAHDPSMGRDCLSIGLSMAAWKCVRALLEHGVPVDGVDQSGRTVLHEASDAPECPVDLFENIRKRGGDINAVDEFGATPLHYAARRGQARVIALLLKNGADMLALNKRGRGVPHYAAEGRPGSLRLLLSRGGDWMHRDDLGRTPLHAAVLVDRATCYFNKEYSQLDPSEEMARIEKAGAILRSHPCVANIRDNRGWTALHIAARQGDADLVDFLCGAGVNMLVLDREGWTPLHHAARWGRGEVVYEMSRHWDRCAAQCGGLTVDLRDRVNGRTPLHVAAIRGHVECVRQLLGSDNDEYKEEPALKWWRGLAGPLYEVRDVHGMTALDIARKMGREEIVYLLEEEHLWHKDIAGEGDDGGERLDGDLGLDPVPWGIPQTG